MYETVEDYKKTKFGLIPNDWIIKKGEGLSTKITKGASPKWQGFDYQDNGILFVTSENVREGVLDVTQPKFLPIEFGEKQKNSKLKKGDILINIVGASIGRSCEYDIDVEANINQAVCLFRAKSEADKSFIKYYLQSNSVKKRLLGTQTESARPNLSLTDIREFEFVLPTNDKEKLKIASILSTWDKAIELKEKLIEQKKEQKKGIMQKLLTGEVRLPGFDGEWKEVKLAKVVKKIKGKAVEYLEGGKFPAIDMDYLESGTFKNYSNDATVFAEKNDVLLLWDGSRAGMAFTGVEGAVGSTFVKLECKSIHNIFLQKHLEMNEQKIQRLREGSGIPHVPKDFLDYYKVKMPSMEEQRAIAYVLNSMDRDLDLLLKEVTYLKKQKQGLMQLLLTGKVRVKV